MDKETGDILADIIKQPLPAHVAIIMDGNGRWAKRKRLPRFKGHAAGAKVIKSLIKASDYLGIEVLTLYCFSTENWRRPMDEVSFLMDLIREFLHKEADEMKEKNVKLLGIGEIEPLPEKVKTEMHRVEALTAENTGLTLNIAINYGGRQEILMAVKSLIEDTKAGKLDPEAFSGEDLERYLYTKGQKDPDLIIRTSGEKRLSNFLLWQSAYAEFYFTNVNWPDFNEKEYYKAIADYQRRQRRYGDIK